MVKGTISKGYQTIEEWQQTSTFNCSGDVIVSFRSDLLYGASNIKNRVAKPSRTNHYLEPDPLEATSLQRHKMSTSQKCSFSRAQIPEPENR